MDFGFSISESNAIQLDKVDTTLYQRLCELAPDAALCMSCGSCTATCASIGNRGMSVRKTLLALQRGKDVRDMLEGCVLCGKCTMVCPRGINTRGLLLKLCTL